MEIKDEDLEAFFDEHFTALTDMAVGRFELSEADAEDVANEILLATLFNLPRVDDIKPWLAGALAYAVQKQPVEA
jgi:DNA-directed RNA polymerase specialized sigma24 family protein